MALLHQKLYQSEGIARIPMAGYIQEMVAYLYDAYELPQPIDFQLAIDPIELDVTQAVPLGLIINETLTNALKYAFPGGRLGTVQMALRQVNKTDYELLIADNGVGLSATVSGRNLPSRSPSEHSRRYVNDCWVQLKKGTAVAGTPWSGIPVRDYQNRHGFALNP